MFNDILKKKIQNNFIVFVILNYLIQTINIFKFYAIFKFKYKYKYISKSKIIEILEKRKKQKNSKICHIIGGGYSLNYSKNKISKKDFVFGCNLSALEKINFDFYSVEFASTKKFYEPKFTVLNLIKKKLKNQKTLIIFKNIASKEINRNFLKKNYQNNVHFITEYSWRCFNLKQLQFYLKNYILKNRSNFYQYNSTIIFLILIAHKLNFKKIVLHGVDFGGKYFFSKKRYKISNQIKFSKELKLYEKKNISRKGVYLNHENLNMPEVFKIIAKYLIEENIILYSGSEKSNASKILKTYKQFK